MKFPRELDLAYLAMAVGPTIMAVGIILLGYQYHRTAQELNSHVLMVLERHNSTEPAIAEIRDNMKKYAVHAKNSEERELDIMRKQDDILIALHTKKLGEVITKRANPYSSSEITSDCRINSPTKNR